MRDPRRDVGNTPQDCHAGVGKPGHFCTNSHVSLAQRSRGGWGLRQTYKKPSVGTDTCLQCPPGWAQRYEQETHSTYRKVFNKYTNVAINPRALLYNLSFPVATSDGRLKAATCSSEPEFITTEHHTYRRPCFLLLRKFYPVTYRMSVGTATSTCRAGISDIIHLVHKPLFIANPQIGGEFYSTAVTVRILGCVSFYRGCYELLSHPQLATAWTMSFFSPP